MNTVLSYRSRLEKIRCKYIADMARLRGLVSENEVNNKDAIIAEFDKILLALTQDTVPNIKQATLCLVRANLLLDDIFTN